MPLVYDPMTGSPQYQRGPLIADEFSQYLELLKQRKEQDRVRQETERLRQVKREDRDRFLQLLPLFEQYPGLSGDTGQPGAEQTPGGPPFLPGAAREETTQPPFLPQGAPPEQGEAPLPQPLAQLLQKRQEQATGVPEDVRQQGQLFGSEAPPEPAQSPGGPAGAQAGGLPPGDSGPDGADPSAYIDWVKSLAAKSFKPAQELLLKAGSGQAFPGSDSGDDYLGKAGGFMNQYLHAARLGQISANPGDPNYIAFDDWVEKIYGIRARGKLREEEEFEPRIAGKKKQSEKNVELVMDPQIAKEVTKAQIAGGGRVTPIQTSMMGQRKIIKSIGKIKEALKELKKEGGIQAADQSGFENLGAWLRGNIAQLPFRRGSKIGSLMSEIEGTRTQILTDLKTAENLGATQMNSAAEMKIFLDSIGDIGSYDAAINLLDNLDEKYRDLNRDLIWLQEQRAKGIEPNFGDAPSVRGQQSPGAPAQGGDTPEVRKYERGPDGKLRRVK